MEDLEQELKPFPNSTKSEALILSCMMQWPELIDRATELGITEESFYVPANSLIFKTLLTLNKKSTPIEILSIVQYLKDYRVLDNIGGESRVAEIYSFSVTSANFEHHCNEVIKKSRLRQVISECTSSIEKAYQNPEDVDEFIDGVEKEIFSIGRSHDLKESDTLKSLLESTVERFAGYIEGKYEIEGLSTRFNVLNDLTRGFKGGEMIVVAARPSMGKTALMCNFIEDFILQGNSGMVFSCEMTSQQVMDRIVYGRAGIPMHLLRKGFVPTKDELRKMSIVIGDLLGGGLFVDDTSAIKIDELRTKARRKKKEHDIKYVAIDYLQLMVGSRKFEGREREITEISSGLKALAKELDIPVIVLAQLNRNAERRQDGIPKMSDLRESGATEQDADIVSLLYRPDYYKGEGEEDETSKKKSPFSKEGERNPKGTPATLIVAKNRNGPTGEVSMIWKKETMQFT